jgi:hypothetical protein
MFRVTLGLKEPGKFTIKGEKITISGIPMPIACFDIEDSVSFIKNPSDWIDIDEVEWLEVTKI